MHEKCLWIEWSKGYWYTEISLGIIYEESVVFTNIYGPYAWKLSYFHQFCPFSSYPLAQNRKKVKIMVSHSYDHRWVNVINE